MPRPEFYPELFLYFPAALRNLGVSLSASVRVFEACINLATALALLSVRAQPDAQPPRRPSAQACFIRCAFIGW